MTTAIRPTKQTRIWRRPPLAAATAVLAGIALLPVLTTGNQTDTPSLRPAAAVSPGPLAEGDVIYQVLVDRFADGDQTNNYNESGQFDRDDLGFYHGGDWAGLTGKLDYIAHLGVTALWISPVSEQEPLSRDRREASYHGYFTKNFATPNRHFGSRAELQELIGQAHQRNLKVVLDVVPNHTADYLAGTATGYNPPVYRPDPPLDQNPRDYYHHIGDCVFDGSMTQDQIERCDLGGLDDLNQDNADVSQHLLTTYRDWVDMGFDGIRVDAARAVPKPWLRTFEQSMGVPTFGEVFVNDVDYVSEYQRYEWGVQDFPYFFNVRDVFSTYSADMNRLGSLFAQDAKYVNPNRLTTFLDNHDRARFLTWADDNYQRFRAALSFLLTSRGIPIIYYGTEQADDGNGNASEVPIANKDNRKDMSSFDESATLYRHIQRLNLLKRSYPALRTGVQREMWKDTGVYAFSRRVDATGAETITAATNGWDRQSRTIPLRAESTIPVGTVLTNLMNTIDTVRVISGGPTGRQITISLGEHEAKVYTPDTPVSAYTPPARNITRIRVHANVGLGNNIAVRGGTYPLRWTSGRGARHVGDNVWEFEFERIPPGQRFEFKPLVNDVTWSSGGNYAGTGGQTIDIYPTF